MLPVWGFFLLFIYECPKTINTADAVNSIAKITPRADEETQLKV
jgi:hypothetical protein